ncbi:MAG TPA: hypothetical protein DFR83_04655, partial [Deltaproteobacteria bacterium]|nr:hypothetical protein [Deltaproteobacteria bacterium]
MKPSGTAAHGSADQSGNAPALELGFRTRLFFVYILLMVFFAGSSVAWLELSLRPLLDRQSITVLEGAAQLARAGVAHRIGVSPTILSQELRELSLASDLRLTVITPDGQVMADSDVSVEAIEALDWHGDRPEVKAALSTGMQGLSRRHSSTLDLDMVYLAVPLDWTDGRTGILRVSSTTERADTAVMALYRLLGVALVGGLGVALFMTWLAASSMNHDLSVLLQHTTTLARGESTAPLKLQYSVELAGLAGSINQMAHEAQRSVRELAEERHRSSIVLQAVRDGLLSVDQDQRLTLVNPACKELLGIGMADLGRQLEHALPLPELLELMKIAVDAGSATGEITLAENTETGATHDRVLRIHISSEDDAGYVVSVHDITRVRRLETVRRDFVANVSHELRTPISIVQASAEALQDGAIDQPKYAAMFLDAILRNAVRLNLLVQDILKLSRIEAGQNILDLETVSVAEVVSDVIQILYTRSTERNHIIISTVDANEAVVADAGSLEQILVNLLENAMKYTDAGAKVRVSSIAVTEERVRILVADNGPGISIEHRPRLFERFYR